MGNNKREIQDTMSAIDGTIHDLEERIAQLRGTGDPAGGQLPLAVEKEINALTQQLDFIRMAKKNIEEQLQQARKEEDRRQLENVLKYAMLIGVINENLKIREARERAFEQRKGTYFSVKDRIRALFDNEEFRYVEEEDVDDIMADEELQEMAASDPNRLTRDALDMKAEYERMMKLLFTQNSQKLSNDFAENEARFQELLKKRNGFDEVLRETAPRIYKEVPEVGTEEDKAYFREVLKEIEDLGEITRRLQEDFLTGESSFERGNGYTKELVDREVKLVQKIEDFGKKRMEWIIEQDPQAKETLNAINVYELSQRMLFPISQQADRDKVLQRNNALRERMERWKVYTAIARGGNGEVRSIEAAEEYRRMAWAKIRRMEKTAIANGLIAEDELSEEELEIRKRDLKEGRAGLEDDVTAWAAEEAQILLEKLDQMEEDRKSGGGQDGMPAAKLQKKEQGPAADLDQISNQLAALVLQRIILEERKRSDDEPRPYYDEIGAKMFQWKFRAMSNELAKTKEFRSNIKQLIKGKDLRQECIRFLAEDREIFLAEKLSEYKRKLTPDKRFEKKPEKKPGKKPEKDQTISIPQCPGTI